MDLHQGENRTTTTPACVAKRDRVTEGGHRVACFARWPGRLPAGHRVNALTSCRDWFPTLVRLCDLETNDIAFDGTDIGSLLRNEQVDWPQRTLFVERQADQPRLEIHPKPKQRYPHYAVLTERWRFVDGELYDVNSDPAQTTNVAEMHPAVTQRLTRAYKDYFADVFSDDAAFTCFQVGMSEENPTRFNVRDWHPTDGNVIWKKEQLADDQLAINGFWAVNVTQPGMYAIRLSRFPSDEAGPIGAKLARLRIGPIDQSKSISAEDPSVTFEVRLPAGKTLLQTWLTDKKLDVERGAYFVEVERIGS